MPDYIYPAGDLDRPGVLAGALGSFWNSVFADQATLRGYLDGRATLEQQVVQDLSELFDSMSRFTVPLAHTERWYPLRLLKSEMNDAAALLRYGDGAVYGNQPADGTLYFYGVPNAVRDYSFPLPAELVGGELAYNRLTSPSLAWTQGLDYVINVERGVISFRTNPFDNELIPRRRVYDGSGVAVDEEAGLWLASARQAVPYIRRHYGYVVGLAAPGPGRLEQLGYRELVNACFDSIVAGATLGPLQAAVAACTGIPATRTDGETVAVVSADERGRIIATDREVYRFPAAAVPKVTVGQTLRVGQALVETVELIEFQNGACPADLSALSLGRGMLAEGYYADLVFVNAAKPLIVEENVDGYTKVSFELGGFPTDAEKFFADLHTAGVAAGSTLAMLLDRRTNKVGQPRAGALPATINPLEFLTQNVLRQNATLLRIRGDLGEGALGLHYLRHLRKLLPPHTTLLTLVELVADRDVIIMDGPGDEDAPGYSEAPALFSAFSVDGDTVAVATLTEDPKLYQVSDRCL